MAKKKAPPAKAVERSPDQWSRQKIVAQIRGSEDWKAWLTRVAEYDRSPSAADLIDRAVTRYAREIGFKEAAPKR